MVARYGPDYRPGIIETGTVVRKKARTVVVQIDKPFEVRTDHGVISAEAGDYLATNHPDDDASSDVWPISAARFAASYEPVPVEQPKGYSIDAPRSITADQLTDLGKRFTYRAPNGERVVRHAVIRDELLEAAIVISQTTKPSREQSLAFTKLEEAMFWANAAIAREE